MNGVEILNTIYEYGSVIRPVYLGLFMLAAFVIAVLGLFTVNYNVIQTILKILEVFAIAGIIVCSIGLSAENDEIVGTKYQVIVSEEVNFNDFMEKYEIIDKEGEIYTVREKE